LVLQNTAFIGHFRESAESRGKLPPNKIDEITPASPHGEVTELLRRDGGKTNASAAAVLGYLNDGGDPNVLMHRARELVFHKGNDAHDYKYSAALLEDYYARSPQWRDRIMAAGSALLPDENAKDTDLAARVHDAFA